MGTVMNGNKWSGACVNGNVVGGLVKNGIVFYKKAMPVPSVYKRRIMVGDVLSNKTLYFNFPNDFYENILERIEINSWEYPIMALGTYSSIKEGNQVAGQLVVLSINMVDTNVYWYDNNSLSQNLSSISAGNFGEVTSINETPCYRNIYIEDPNIRPLQVGDKIVSGTKLYFNFPDDFSLNLEETAMLSIGNSYILINPDNTVLIYGLGNITFIFSPKNSSLEFTNQSSYVFKQDIGEVDVTESNIFNEYIFVDTTTLGS